MNMDAYMVTSSFWYAQFRNELCLGNSKIAEEYFTRSVYWKRRSRLDRMLSGLCEQKNFCQEKKYGKRNRLG